MPLWQSMQVPPFFDAGSICATASALCLWKSIASKEWQLRHSAELSAFNCAHTSLAMRRRCASNFSGVSMPPAKCWIRSLVAKTLAISMGTRAFGTWQSAHTARTPEAFL